VTFPGGTTKPAAFAHPRVLSRVFFLVIASLLFTLLVLVGLAIAPAASAASGDIAWQRAYSGGNDDLFTALARAPHGGVYVVGSTITSNYDILAGHYDAAGQRIFIRTFNGPLDSPDFGQAAASDPFGNLIVAGYVNYLNPQLATVIKYGPGGKRKWVRFYDDPQGGAEQFTSVATDTAGNIYAAGFRISQTTGYDIIMVKYSPAGVFRWVRRYAQPGDAQPSGIALDGSGNVYLTGSNFDTVGNSYDVVTLKYDPAGHRRWVRVWNSVGSGEDYGNAIAVTRTGIAYVAGSAGSATTGYDPLLLKYSPAGVLRWARLSTVATAQDDAYNGIALLGNGDVAATGYVAGVAAQDVLTARLSPAGQTHWATTYNGADNLDDVGYHVAGGPNGAIYVVGDSNGATTGTDILTLKYNGVGVFRWSRRHSSAGNFADFSSALLIYGGGVYVAGYQASNTNRDGVLLKYRP
jgi:Beta-propeller repeat